MASVSVAFVASGQQLIERQLWHGLAKSDNVLKDTFDVGSPMVNFWDQPRNRFTVTHDDHRLAALYMVEHAAKAGI